MNQKGAIPLLILLTALGVLISVAVFSYAPTKKLLYETFFPKKESKAAEGVIYKNLLQNSSFELIGNNGWGGHGLGKLTEQNFATAQNCHGGNFCLKLDFPAGAGATTTFSHKAVKVQKGKTYQFSFWVKSTTNSHITPAFMYEIPNTTSSLPYSYLKVFSPVNIPINSTYKRVNIGITFPDDAKSDYLAVEFMFQPEPGNTPTHQVYIDDVQLETHDAAPWLTDYEAPGPEFMLTTDQPGNLFTIGEYIKIRASSYNPSMSGINFTGKAEISDVSGTLISSKDINFELKANTTSTLEFYPPFALPSGFYTVKLISSDGNSLAKLSLGVIPALKGISPEQSSFGNHFNPLNPGQVALEKKLGDSWTRGLTFANLFRWSSVEPQQGQWNFEETDRVAQSLRDNNIKGLAVLVYAPGWAGSSSTPNNEQFTQFLNLYATYVQQVVHRYKDTVKYWEIWNEPFSSLATNMSLNPPMNRYAEMLKKVYPIIKTECQECQVLGLDLNTINDRDNENQPMFIDSFIAAGGADFLDIVATHLYVAFDKNMQPDASTYDSSLNQFQYQMNGINYYFPKNKPDSKPIWMTESSIPNKSFYDYYTIADDRGGGGGTFPNATKMENYDPQDAARYISRYNTLALANGIEKMFYYFNSTGNHLPTMPNSQTMLEFDGAVKPMAVAYAVSQRMLDGLVFDSSNSIPDTRTANPYRIYTFKNNKGQKTSVLWSAPNKTSEVKYPTAVTVTELYGKETVKLPNQPITITQDPIFIQEGVISVPILKANLNECHNNKAAIYLTWGDPLPSTQNVLYRKLASLPDTEANWEVVGKYYHGTSTHWDEDLQSNTSYDYRMFIQVNSSRSEAVTITTETKNCSSSPATAEPSDSVSSKRADIVPPAGVDIFDYSRLLTDFGKKGQVVGDIDKSGIVDIFDYNLLLTDFGK